MTPISSVILQVESRKGDDFVKKKISRKVKLYTLANEGMLAIIKNLLGNHN